MGTVKTTKEKKMDFKFNVENGVAVVKAETKEANQYLESTYGVSTGSVAFNDSMIMTFSSHVMKSGLSLQQEAK